jgi:hypothetical protein
MKIPNFGARSANRGSDGHITSAPIRDPLADHLITQQNAALLLIDYQPAQVASVRSMDHELLVKNAVSTVRTIKAFDVPVVHSTVNVSSGQGEPTIPELNSLLARDPDGMLAEFVEISGGGRHEPGNGSHRRWRGRRTRARDHRGARSQRTHGGGA